MGNVLWLLWLLLARISGDTEVVMARNLVVLG